MSRLDKSEHILLFSFDIHSCSDQACDVHLAYGAHTGLSVLTLYRELDWASETSPIENDLFRFQPNRMDSVAIFLWYVRHQTSSEGRVSMSVLVYISFNGGSGEFVNQRLWMFDVRPHTLIEASVWSVNNSYNLHYSKNTMQKMGLARTG